LCDRDNVDYISVLRHFVAVLVYNHGW